MKKDTGISKKTLMKAMRISVPYFFGTKTVGPSKSLNEWSFNAKKTENNDVQLIFHTGIKLGSVGFGIVSKSVQMKLSKEEEPEELAFKKAKTIIDVLNEGGDLNKAEEREKDAIEDIQLEVDNNQKLHELNNNQPIRGMQAKIHEFVQIKATNYTSPLVGYLGKNMTGTFIQKN